MDLFHRLLESSDPLITSKRNIHHKHGKPYDSDARYMMDLSDSEDEADSDTAINDRD